MDTQMINLNEYSLDTVPDYCLYSKNFSSVWGQPKFGVIYINPNTKFGHWFEMCHKNLSKRAEWFKSKPVNALCCEHITSKQLYVYLKQVSKIQSLKDGKGYKEFLQWIHKELNGINGLIWFTSYRYLEQLYDGTLWSNSKNIR